MRLTKHIQCLVKQQEKLLLAPLVIVRKGLVYIEKTCLAKKGHYPGRANSSYVSYKTWRPVYMRNKKLDSPFVAGRVTLLAGPTFLHTNTLIHPAGSTRSRRDNQSMREHCYQLLAQVKRSFVLSYEYC